MGERNEGEDAETGAIPLRHPLDRLFEAEERTNSPCSKVQAFDTHAMFRTLTEEYMKDENPNSGEESPSNIVEYVRPRSVDVLNSSLQLPH